MTCVVDMDALVIPPFDLENGHLIMVRISARTPLGWSPFSEPNTSGASVLNGINVLGSSRNPGRVL
jgi:hypothetical protein